jgi:ABC-type ATPase with predicted acetyltransferase domain
MPPVPSPKSCNFYRGPRNPTTLYKPQEVFIAVSGQSGTGKTTFINEVTGKGLKVGHSLESCMWPYLGNSTTCRSTIRTFPGTKEPAFASTNISRHPMTLTDTQGFDYGGDYEILELIGF